MVGAAAVGQRVVVREDAPGPTAPRSQTVSRRRRQPPAADSAAARVAAHGGTGQDGRLGNAVGVAVGEAAVQHRLSLHRHRDGGEGSAAATVRPTRAAAAAAAATNVERVLEAPPHVVLLAPVDYKAEDKKKLK